jgi:hypothetical protein
MMRRWVALAAAALVMALSGCSGVYQETEVRASIRSPGSAVSVSYFYDDLSPYGRWIDYSPYGWCWTPYDVSPGWRPYTAGSWVYTEFGWTWASSEPWGWAAYHYGRWQFDPAYGWLWIPGAEWGPAWVAWHYGDDWVGWAPLPPSASWDAAVGLRFGDVDRIPAQHWCFVERAHLTDANVRVRVVSVARNVTLLAETRDATRFEARGGHPVNDGLDINDLERRNGRRIARHRVVDVDAPSRGRGQSAGGGAVGFFRPAIRDEDLRKAPPPEVQQREVAIAEPELRRQQETERRRLDQSLAEERSRLEREHERELRFQPPGTALDVIRRRHAAEKQVLEEHAAEQRQVLEKRYEKRIVKPARGKGPGKPREKGQDRERGEG